MNKKLMPGIIVIVATLGLVAFAFFSVFTSNNETLTDRERLEKIIAHRSDSIQKIWNALDVDGHNAKRANSKPGKMGQAPDLYMEEEFLALMDPALGYVPHERRVAAMQITERMMNEQSKFPTFQALNLNWTERGPSTTGGRTRAIMFDPNDNTNRKVWAGGVSGGLWFTNDITAPNPTWNKMSDMWENLAITGLAFDPTNTQIMYAATGEGFFNADAVRGAGIWKTTNGGTSWSRLASTDNVNWFFIQKIMVAPNGHVYAATREAGVIRSIDKGLTWQRVYGAGSEGNFLLNRIADIEIAANGTVYITDGIFYSGGIYRSTTGNAGTFVKLTNGLPSGDAAGNGDFNRIEIAISKSNPLVLYAAFNNNGTVNGFPSNHAGRMFKSTNGGDSWTAITLPTLVETPFSGDVGQSFANQAWYCMILEVNPTNPDEIYAGGLDLYKSADGGQNWSQVSQWFNQTGTAQRPYVHADQHAIVYRPSNNTTALYGHDGGISISTNTNATTPSFTTINQNYNITQYYAGAIHPNAGVNYFLGGTQDNGTIQLTTPTFGPGNTAFGGDGAFCHIDQLNPLIQIVSSQNNNMFLSTDGLATGIRFQSQQLIPSRSGDGSFINITAYDSREKTIYADVSRGTNTEGNLRFWRSRNLSTTVNGTNQDSSRFVIGNTGGARMSAMALSPHAPVGTSRLYIGTRSGKVFVIVDAKAANPNAILEITGNLPAGNISSLEVGNTNDEILATISNFGVAKVHKTTDGGNTWVNKTGNFPDIPVRWAWSLPSDRKVVLIGTETGVWGTENINATSPVWVPLNSGLANVRVSQLKWRSSDNTLLSITHGRGMFTANTTNLVTSVRSRLADDAIAVFPNPATDFINIQAKNSKLTKVVITNLLGQTVYQSEIKNTSEFRIETADFKSGIYLVNLSTDNGILTKRIRIN